MSQAIVVVGAGQAGGWAAHTLRNQGHAGPIVLVGEERHPPYERPPLSKGILTGTAPAETVTIFATPALERLGIEWRPAVKCLSIDRGGRCATMSDGTSVHYEKLIVCTGGRARALRVRGTDLSGVYMLRSLDDAVTIAGRLEPGKRLVAIGGGWIGLEVAASARKRGLEVTVVEAETRLCPRTVSPEASSYLLGLHKRHGTRVLLGCSVQQIVRTGEGSLAVELKGEQVLRADIVVVGIGLTPNEELARDAGLECDGGIIVDARCRTSDDHIYAAGDVTIAYNQWYGKRLRLESWQNAQDQAVAAAKAALGKAVHYDPLPRFWSDQYDIRIQILGYPGDARGVSVVRQDPASDGFMIFCVDGTQLLGVFAVNSAADLREARRLLMKGTPVLAETLRDRAFDLAEM